jgi:hypothetical protein
MEDANGRKAIPKGWHVAETHGANILGCCCPSHQCGAEGVVKNELARLFIGRETDGPIRPRSPDEPHPFKGKVVADITPADGTGWIIQFSDGTEFHI